MKHYVIKPCYVLTEKGVTNATVSVIAKSLSSRTDKKTFMMSLETDKVVCIDAPAWSKTDIKYPVTSYWFEDEPDKVFEGNFELQVQQSLLEVCGYAEDLTHETVAIGKWIHQIGKMFVVRQAHRMRTLCFPHEDGLEVIKNVNSGYLRDGYKIFYHVDDEYFILWLHNWRREYIGKIVLADIYDCTDKKILHHYSFNIGMKEIISYISLIKRGGRLIVEVSEGKYRIFEGYSSVSEQTQNYYVLPLLTPHKAIVFHRGGDFYTKIAEPEDVVFYTQNAFVKAEVMESSADLSAKNEVIYHLYGLGEGRPFLIANCKDEMTISIDCLHFGNLDYRINGDMLDYKPTPNQSIKKAPWWKFWAK